MPATPKSFLQIRLSSRHSHQSDYFKLGTRNRIELMTIEVLQLSPASALLQVISYSTYLAFSCKLGFVPDLTGGLQISFSISPSKLNEQPDPGTTLGRSPMGRLGALRSA